MSELDSIFEQVMERSKEWRPKFVEVDDVDICADLINKPHDDYPIRIPMTKFCLENLVVIQEEELDEGFLFMIHSTIMQGLESRGQYRKKNVHIVGSSNFVNIKTGELETKRDIIYTPPDYLLVPTMMKRIMPTPIDDLIGWYSRFQSIHPFEDGNGRVGGVVVGALSFIKTGKYLAPLQ